ncbi:Crp/Fnr family transcriptional regulator [Sphingomonas ginsenosidivorax]|uniref:Crp/Fnr family transcriptional regulator n=1 Tax=Sphingomonas ginsenosidivorax TaxID=862135 RepID=A0A5C6UFL0_9SPHN|nr:Crp/Fnr family transcriptional regulator [Sphingomonas ginsenosidivorax]TXC70728.1 Crp/Fnr family transcriptional regulator [Sphingomonas ginsenosidivorax]
MADLASPLALMVRKLEIHTPLQPDDREALLSLPHTLKTYEPSAYLVREGEAPEQCAVLLSGFAFRQKLTGQGMRQIVSMHIPGDALDFQHLFLDIADHNVQTLTRADVATIPRTALRNLARSRSAIGNAIFVSTLVEGSISREWVLNVGRRDARSRLAHLLCEFAVRLDVLGLAGDQGYELPMSQEQLADALGLTAVHVNRTIKSLEADGLITRNRRRISFPRWDALRDLADFSTRYLHLEHAR